MIYYVVQVLKKWGNLTAGPYTIGGMSGAEGCNGFMPVFDSMATALAWRDENHPDAGVAGITDSEKEEIQA